MQRHLRILVLCGLVAIAGVACSSAGGSAPPLSTPGGGTGGGSVGSGGDPGSGIEHPVVPIPGDGAPPGVGRATMVVPKPGRLDVHPVAALTIEATVTGRRVQVRLTWWSGVEPCSVLDSVGVARTGTDIDLTILEGADQLGGACIEIAMLKGTIVDLGELPVGTYTISAGDQAPPVHVTVS